MHPLTHKHVFPFVNQLHQVQIVVIVSVANPVSVELIVELEVIAVARVNVELRVRLAIGQVNTGRTDTFADCAEFVVDEPVFECAVTQAVYVVFDVVVRVGGVDVLEADFVVGVAVVGVTLEAVVAVGEFGIFDAE